MTDADFNDTGLRFLRDCGRENLTLIRNKHIPHVGKRAEFDNSQAALNQAIFADIEAGKKIFLATDSRKAANIYYELIKKKTSVRLITSREGNKAGLSDPDAFFGQDQVGIVSPAVIYGINVTIPHDVIYGYYKNNTITSIDQAQQLNRVRNCNPNLC